ncbi:hypothetical protein Pla175_30470 [Pirellulimonas nuda]|uniref:PEP-CTERM protein-sorting domain-containing protein n=1 Tax=Pirellulimonas nuda TaxID=2528009 RepID=A0A518DDU0_9BACT|nr:hypothetical protein [Pirellulimonas nuda]QDU89654.1 hypothetical protein Pla175_30470 [Pirellulimonas nuda]
MALPLLAPAAIPDRRSRRCLPPLLCIAAVLSPGYCSAQTLVNDLNGTLSLGGAISSGVSGIVGQIAFAPGDASHVYVGTFGGGITRFDYNPASPTFLSNPLTAAPTATTSSGGVIGTGGTNGNGGFNGTLGLAFHQDPVLGTVMYLAPAVRFKASDMEPLLQPIVRLNDADGDGVFGNGADLNQTIVSDIAVTSVHQVNQLQVRGNTLYVNIGVRTQNGGQTAAQNMAIGGTGVDQSNPGETAYTGTLSFIEDLTALSSDTTTTNISGFTIVDVTGDGVVNDLDVRADVQPFTSTDPSKLRVFSTGFRNNYGLGIDDSGEIWVSYNQNENPTLPDELHRSVTFQSDHGFFKGNNIVGDWKVSGDEHPSLQMDASQLAIDAGYFNPANSATAFQTVGNHVAAGGLDFFRGDVADPDLAGDVLMARNSGSGRDVLYIDRETGATTVVLEGLTAALEVARDPFGNFLAGGNGVISLLLVDSGSVFGDLDGDQQVLASDWMIFRTYLDTDVSLLTLEQAALRGDLDADLDIDVHDFALFKTAFEQANGPGSFASLGVPEPNSLGLALLSLTGIMLRKTRRGARERRRAASMQPPPPAPRRSAPTPLSP